MKLLGLSTLAMAIGISGCFDLFERDEPSGSGVKGSRDDVATPIGQHNGFEFTDACESPARDFGVIGLGGQWFNSVAPGEDGRADALSEFSRTVVFPLLQDIPSVHSGGGWGLGCVGIAASVSLDDFRDVDEVVERVGGMLRERDLQEEVAVSVEGVPVAHVSNP